MDYTTQITTALTHFSLHDHLEVKTAKHLPKLLVVVDPMDGPLKTLSQLLV
jgi:hypothetical protein